MNNLFNSTPTKILASLLMFMVLLALGSYTSLNYEKAKHLDQFPATISVTGEGEVFAVPDIGQFTFSVQAEADDATVAQEESGTKINDIVAYLTEVGVEEKDIKTTSYNLYPKYRWEERICTPGTFCGPGEQIQDGFEINQSIQVKIRNTDDASAIITGVGERGATNISGLNFVIDDTDTLVAEARAAAIVDAKEKAAILAKDLGVRIIRLSGYTENNGYDQPMMYRAQALDAAEESGFGGPSLPMGEEQTTAQVTITYEVR